MPSARLACPDDRTERLDLHRPSPADAAEVHAILSDPAVWTHYPSLRVTDPAQTERVLRTWTDAWDRDGLGSWIVRERDSEKVVGFGGCGIAHDAFWNLGYRFSPTVHGRGYATEVALRGSSARGPDGPTCRSSPTSSSTTARRPPWPRRRASCWSTAVPIRATPTPP
jgi:hypothetical protein